MSIRLVPEPRTFASTVASTSRAIVGRLALGAVPGGGMRTGSGPSAHSTATSSSIATTSPGGRVARARVQAEPADRGVERFEAELIELRGPSGVQRANARRVQWSAATAVLMSRAMRALRRRPSRASSAGCQPFCQTTPTIREYLRLTLGADERGDRWPASSSTAWFTNVRGAPRAISRAAAAVAHHETVRVDVVCDERGHVARILERPPCLCWPRVCSPLRCCDRLCALAARRCLIVHTHGHERRKWVSRRPGCPPEGQSGHPRSRYRERG